jgi:hypothetical protein
MMSRFLSPARLMPWILVGLVSLVVLPLPVLAQGTGGQSPVTIIINGTETPDELKKLIDSVSSQGHPVSVTFAAKPDKPGSGHPDSKASAEEEEFFDLFTRGVKDGLDTLPQTPDYFADVGQW